MSSRIHRTLSANLNRLNLGARSHQLNLVAGIGISTLSNRPDHPFVEMVDPMRAEGVVAVVEPYPPLSVAGFVSPAGVGTTTTTATTTLGSSSSPASAAADAGARARVEMAAEARAALPPVADGRKCQPDRSQGQDPRSRRDWCRSAGRRADARAAWLPEAAPSGPRRMRAATHAR